MEDVSVREGYEGMKIGSALMEAALQYCKEKEVYKITLTAKEKVVGFYEKYGFERYSINMKKYCK
ncbi:MAG: GNAT family N-acetyltransferase [Patescibacteria group bacterium]|nr:GNAT family N-acetyltransferase [Patescibacteria group bacterium]